MTTTFAGVENVTMRYRAVTALDGVGFDLTEHAVHGLLGRNGAGKTTLLQVLSGQTRPSTGRVSLLGRDPHEDDPVRAQVCLVRDDQTYPDWFTVDRTLEAAALLFPSWDAELARSLVDDFALPGRRKVKRLSRGMTSAVGIVVGLASRAPLTLFDEPSLGLDAVSRQTFYDRLLADIAVHPRTVVLSTHLIDEVASLVERVLVLDQGRLLLDEDAESLRGRAVTVSGPAGAVDRFAAGRQPLHRDEQGVLGRLTLMGPLAPDDRHDADALGLQVQPLSLQQLVVATTRRTTPRTDPTRETTR